MTPTEEYRDKMNDLAGDLADAVVEAGRAWLLARNIDGMPEADLLKIKHRLEAVERDVESLIEYGVTSTEMQDMRALYEGAKRAGLTR